MLKTILMIRHFKVVEAGDGVEALQKLSAESFDVVFSDVSMPNMNGFELLTRVKRSVRTAAIPVVMLTSENQPEDLAKGKKLGCSTYLIKPFNSEKLNLALKSAGLGSTDHLGG
jgi:two-component system sensor histidine kinase/response regulator